MRCIKVATAPTEAQDVINDNETSLVTTHSSMKIKEDIQKVETVSVTYSVSGTATLSDMAAKRYGNFLNVRFALNPTATIAAGGTVVVTLNSTQVTLPSVAKDGTATGASFYGTKVFTYQYNTDNAGAVKVRNHSQWLTGEVVTFCLNIPLLSF